MLTIRWDDGFPAEARRAVLPVVQQYLWLVPGWCRVLALVWRDWHEDDVAGDSAAASTSTEVEYRHATLFVHAPWLSATPTERRANLIHELLHIPMAPMVDEQRATIRALFADGEAPKFQAHIEEQWRQRFEGSVQDLAFAILRIGDSALPGTNYVMDGGDE